MPRNRSHPTPLATLLLAPALALAACAGADASTPVAERTGAVAREVPAGTSLVVADQQQQLQTSFAASGQDRQLDADVSYANFVGGPAILEAFRAGAADLAVVGDTPPVQALAAGEDVQIVAAKRTSPEATRLAVAAGADVHDLDDLRGKRIAYAEGTAQQTIVLRALAAAGLGTTDVDLVRLQLSDFLDAVRTGQVDVAVLGEPNVTRFLEGTPGGTTLPVEQTRGLATGLSYLYARGEALSDPAKAAAVADYVTGWIGSQEWADDNPDAWVRAYYVDSQHVSAEDGARIVTTAGPTTFPPLDADLVDAQQRTIDVIADAGELPVDDLRAADGFDLRYGPVVADAATAAGTTTTPLDQPAATS